MRALHFLLCLALILIISDSHAGKRVSDMMPSGAWMGSEKHARLQGWSLDTNGWNEGLYPSINYRRGPGKIVAHLTSDSPALVGSNITFTARLEFPKCQKEDENGDPVYEKHCKDVDASVHPGESVYNGTSWSDDYGFGNCSNKSNCNVFPDGKPFPQRLDWRRNSYVYVWHTMGQYYQKHDRSVSSITLNTTNITLGAQLMDLSVYRKSNRRKYSPAATASGIYFVTVMPSTTAPSSTKSPEPTSRETATAGSATQTTAPLTTDAVTQTTAPPTTRVASTTKTFNTITTASTLATTTELGLLQRRRRGLECKLYRHGSFIANLSIVAGIITVESVRTTSIKVSTASVTDVIVYFLVKCNGSIPTSACTIILDSTCKVTKNIICDKVPAADQCQLTLHRAFKQSGIFCVNITLSDSASLALASTHLTIGEQTKYIVPKEASVIAGAVLVVLTAVAGLVLYKRYKEYKPVNGHPGDGSVEGVTIYFSQLKVALFPGNEERNPLLQGKMDSD